MFKKTASDIIFFGIMKEITNNCMFDNKQFFLFGLFEAIDLHS